VAGFDVRMVHAAGQPFTVAALAARLESPDTTCIDADPAACDFVLEGVANDRIYLGFFNVTRADAIVSPSPQEFPDLLHNPFYDIADLSPGTAYFSASFANVTGDGEYSQWLYGSYGLIPFLPEPSAAVLLGLALLVAAAFRLRG